MKLRKPGSICPLMPFSAGSRSEGLARTLIARPLASGKKRQSVSSWIPLCGFLTLLVSGAVVNILFDLGMSGLTLYAPMVVALSGLWGLCVLGRQTRFTPTLFDLAYLLFVCWALISGFASSDPKGTIFRVLGLPFLWLTVRVFCDSCVSREEDFAALAKSLIVMGVIFSFASVVRLALGFPLGQIAAVAGNANQTGLLLIYSIPALLWWRTSVSTKLGGLISVYILALMLVGMFFSLHRGSWLALSFSLLFLVFRDRGRTVWPLFGVFLLLAAAVPFLGAMGGLPSNIYSFLTSYELRGGLKGRPFLWYAAVRSVIASPLLGTGLGSTNESISRYVTGAYGHYALSLPGLGPHNALLKIAVDTGLVGAALYFSCVLGIPFALLRRKMGTTSFGRVRRLLLALLLGGLVVQATESIVAGGYTLSNACPTLVLAMAVRLIGLDVEEGQRNGAR